MVTATFVLGVIQIIAYSITILSMNFFPTFLLSLFPSNMSIVIIYFIIFIIWFIPMLWTIPMVICVNKARKGESYLSTGFKICYLLFVSLIGGILLLLDNEEWWLQDINKFI